MPSSREELQDLVSTLTKAVFDLKQSKSEERAIGSKGPTSSSLATGVIKAGDSDDGGRKDFLEFVADLVNEICQGVYSCESEPQNPPWMPRKNLDRLRAALPKTLTQLVQLVRREVFIHFNYEKRAKLESLVVRWSQKRRDRVDQILVRELHAEEPGWIDYSRDEAVIKNQVADSIAELLVDDVCKFLKEIQKKNRKKTGGKKKKNKVWGRLIKGQRRRRQQAQPG